ncbi:MAG: Kae1-associated kinase Bud32 [Candidatus Thalassarchaeum betae]|uniref:non-specific serine/threonine protein kinase n=1 Tax=Candidatus Thalassarchaeum betae TaxID=2599289 RepID=A0A2V3HRC4_9ARCH|nr:MAG: Kae1-associated kinase Bud32 [Candidatus Thalassoarchaea betae]PXF26561.1 MAG: Kae1-associated kinase Bud32 [Euryarchaeota archaeon]HIC50945.1 Kae1-associated serine/threonine protein kinase [Candidatus Poseidoniales archaeon]HIM14122.1 Kae1-associated serine/threonine protein kinase [Candidatus Poseidoniales archaeon]HIM92481.1 Kae1-associated serine/threonine protein kinase [Candidatus Poseidoniales archaeon]
MATGAIPMWMPEKVLHEGAEATVTSGSWLGKPAVLKMRRPRGYRHPDLDRSLTRQRLSVEARVLGRLQTREFPSPAVYDLDIEEGWMLLSRIDGRPLYDALKDDSADAASTTPVGALIRNLHEAGISHGDMTTHNILVDTAGALYLIDFGLARISPELEHLGIDLQVLNECLTASHSEHEGAVQSMVDGYLAADAGGAVASAEEVVARFNAIRGRVRYHG